MELPVAPPGTRCVPGQRLLLTASLLTLWGVPTTAQLAIEAVPPSVAEGQDVLLRAHNLGENLHDYYWFNADLVHESHLIARFKVATNSTRPGAAHGGRETIYHNGSLLLQNLTKKDSGFYTLLTVNADGDSELASVEVGVYQPVTEPSIHATMTAGSGQDSVILTCLLEGHDGLSIRWLFNNESLRLTDRMKLSSNSSVLTIDPVRREDAGEYQCEVSNPVSSSKSDTLRLAVIATGSPSGLPAGTVAGIVIGVLAGVALVSTLCCLLFLARTSSWWTIK